MIYIYWIGLDKINYAFFLPPLLFFYTFYTYYLFVMICEVKKVEKKAVSTAAKDRLWQTVFLSPPPFSVLMRFRVTRLTLCVIHAITLLFIPAGAHERRRREGACNSAFRAGAIRIRIQFTVGFHIWKSNANYYVR